MKAKKVKKVNAMVKKAIREMVENQLVESLQIWKRDLGEEEFMARIKKASKLFARKIVSSREINISQSAKRGPASAATA